MSEKIQSEVQRAFWKQQESRGLEHSLAMNEVLPQLRWDRDGLLPAIAQQHDTGQVLMLAWMNRSALEETLGSGRVCYWSRSRQRLWRKGESSGQTQWLRGLEVDCDGDALLLQVDQQGPACHTGRQGCFYFRVVGDRLTIVSAPLQDPATLYPDRDASGGA